MSSHAPLVSPCRQRASAHTARVQVVLQYLNGAPDLDGSYPYLREIGSLETDCFVLHADGFPASSKKAHWLQLLLVCLIHLVDLTHRIICVFVLLVFVARVVACAWTVRLQMSSCSIELSTNRLTTQLNLCALLNLWHLINLLHAYRSTMSTVVRAPSLHSTCFLLGCWQTADC